MKTALSLFILILAVVFTFPAFAQVPQKMNYQAVARNSSGTPITNHLIGIKFTIRESSASGPDIFAETMTANTNSMGTFSVEIGGGTAVLGSFATIPWSTGAKYLNIKIDPAGGNSYTDMGTYQLLSVAYAQLAKNVVNNDDADANPINELQNLSITGDQLSISNGNTVTIPDGSTTNELQTLSIAGNQLSISSGNTVTLPDGGGSPGGANGNVQFNNAGAFGGDNTFFWNNANKRLGLGTSTPIGRLHIKGYDNNWDAGIVLEDDASSVYSQILGSTEGLYLRTPTVGNKMLFCTNLFPNGSSPAMVIYDNAKVGIGGVASEPMGQLEVKSNSDGSTPHLMLTENGDDFARINFKNTANPTKAWHIAGYNGSADANSMLDFWYFNGSNGASTLCLRGDGKIGINNSSPEYQLDIWGGASSSYVTFKNNSTGNTAGNGMVVGSRFDGVGLLVQQEAQSMIIATQYSSPISFNTANNIRMFIAADGKIAIGGSNSPGALTDISGGGAGLSFPALKATNNNSAGIAAQFINAGTDATLVVTNSYSGGSGAILAKFFDGGAGDLIRFSNFNGNHVGSINLYGNNTGTQSGGSLLGMDMYGLVGACLLNGTFTALTETRANATEKMFEPFISGDTKLGSSAYKWKEVWATNGTIQTSDERDKQNVQPLNSGLNAVLQLKPVSFQWKNENSRTGTGINMGFIAQDLERVIPNAVVHVFTPQEEIDNAKASGKGDLPADVYGVKYAEIVPVLVKAIQDQQVIVQDQLKLIQDQQQIITDLQHRVEKLENR